MRETPGRVVKAKRTLVQTGANRLLAALEQFKEHAQTTPEATKSISMFVTDCP
ncbi:hypothetical protein PAMC26577_08020 [Caballeronia sordidicola]|uniref:Uncharacterized protein n=1 Tax=Caballeronia sordidicola TaxID=196367 RepID=A0A242N1K9_CABSO|nr:hypothetical protein PAMC26577_08020 [Caballeronia sordidicola]